MSLFEVPTIQMTIFMLSKSAGVLFFSPVSIPKIFAATIRNDFHTNVSSFMSSFVVPTCTLKLHGTDDSIALSSTFFGVLVF